MEASPTKLLVAIGLWLIVGTSLVAQTSQDSKFAAKVAQGSEAEVQLGKLAARKATDPDIKAFAQLMVHDLSQANEQLMSLAKDESVSLPASMNAKQQATFNKLSKLSGSSFDQAYVQDMVKDHQADIKAFKKESTTGSDPKIKNFAAETLPVLEGHLHKITTIESQMGAVKADI